MKETPYRQALRAKILTTAMNAFYQSGIHAVKMDDIAKQLGISKRTLYEIFADKQELLYQGVKDNDQQNQKYLMDFANSHHVIDIVMEAYRSKAERMQNISPLFFDDITKYPKVAEYIMIRQEEGRQKLLSFLERGVSEGFFTKEMNYSIIVHLFDAIGKQLVDNKLNKQFSIEELFFNLYLVAIRGICTPQGIAAINQALLKFGK